MTMNKMEQSKEDLKEKLSFYTQTLNETQSLSNIGSWNWNVQTNEVEWSDMMFEMLGLKPNESEPSYELALSHVHQEDKDTYIQTLEKALSGKKSYYLENRIVKKNGDLTFVISRGMCVLDKEENLIRFIGTVQDITDFKKKELRLHRQEEKIRDYALKLEQRVESEKQKLLISETKLQQAQRTAKLGVWDWNLESNEILWSAQLYENFDLEPGSKVTMDDFMKYIHPEDLEYVQKRVAETRIEGTPQVLNYRIITPKRNIKYMLGISEQLLDKSGNIIKMLGIVQDVSGFEKLKNLQSQVDSVLEGQEMERERIAADLHDSINPLLSIARLNAETLLEFYENREGIPNKSIENIISNLDNAVDGIKEISRNLSPELLKNFGLEKAVVHLSDGIVNTRQLQIEYLFHDMKERLSPKLELALYRCVQELLNNILKHAKATSADLQLLRHNDSVVLMVSDNGVGFDRTYPELMSNGYGFKNITSRIESFDGKIDIDSALERGTTVTIEVPV